MDASVRLNPNGLRLRDGYMDYSLPHMQPTFHWDCNHRNGKPTPLKSKCAHLKTADAVALQSLTKSSKLFLREWTSNILFPNLFYLEIFCWISHSIQTFGFEVIVREMPDLRRTEHCFRGVQPVVVHPSCQDSMIIDSIYSSTICSRISNGRLPLPNTRLWKSFRLN